MSGMDETWSGQLNNDHNYPMTLFHTEAIALPLTNLSPAAHRSDRLNAPSTATISTWSPVLSTGSSYAPSAASSTTEHSTMSKRRRSHSAVEDLGEAAETDLSPPKRKSLRDDSPHSDGEPTFACPYAKYDPAKYHASNLAEPKYRTCSTCNLKDISRVKQHLYRVHSHPNLYCPTCYRDFKRPESLNKHVESRTCIPRDNPFEDRISEQQIAVIRKKDRGTDPLLCWRNIYATLFPGSKQPESPFADFGQPSGISLDNFTSHVQEHLPPRLAEQLHGYLMTSHNNSAQAIQSMTEAIRSALIPILCHVRESFDSPASDASLQLPPGPPSDLLAYQSSGKGPYVTFQTSLGPGENARPSDTEPASVAARMAKNSSTQSRLSPQLPVSTGSSHATTTKIEPDTNPMSRYSNYLVPLSQMGFTPTYSSSAYASRINPDSHVGLWPTRSAYEAVHMGGGGSFPMEWSAPDGLPNNALQPNDYGGWHLVGPTNGLGLNFSKSPDKSQRQPPPNL